jgi:hypothetical protein
MCEVAVNTFSESQESIPSLAESIPGLFKRLKIRAQDFASSYDAHKLLNMSKPAMLNPEYYFKTTLTKGNSLFFIYFFHDFYYERIYMQI